MKRAVVACVLLATVMAVGQSPTGTSMVIITPATTVRLGQAISLNRCDAIVEGAVITS